MFPVTQHLLVFTIISVLSLTRAQTTTLGTTTVANSITSDGNFTTTTTPIPQISAHPGATTAASSITSDGSFTTTTTTIAPSTTNPVPEIFYPFGLAAGETEMPVGEETSYLVNISSPFIFFSRAFSQIYVNGNGFLSFKQPLYELEYFVFPAAGSEDLIAPLYSDIDDYGSGVVSYHEYTNGSVLTRASQDINQYFSRNDFNANWVFVATWNYGSFYGGKSLFQVVLISGGNLSFVLMNYDDMAEAQSEVQAGYNTANSEHYFVIPHSNELNYLPNLKHSSNVNDPGRWFFRVSNVPEIFYPFGLEAGETEMTVGEETSYLVNISSPFIFFSQAFSQIYVNGNGFLSFKQPLYELENFVFPAAGSEDLIAPLYTDIDDYMSGVVSYHEYTNGSVLTRASQDINQYFSRNGFNANWVFVATWNYGGMKSLFQVVLISGGYRSFVLMNYGDMEEAQSEVQAGYNTANSEHYFVIPHSNEFNYLPNLKYSSNVNVPGRWFFSVSNEILVGLRMTITSFSDLTQTGNIETVLKQLKQELINRGVSNTLDLKLRAVKKTNP